MEEFKKRYHRELRNKPELVARLKQKEREGTVTLLFAARDSEHSNAAVLKEVLNHTTALSQEGSTMKRTALKAAALVMGMVMLFVSPSVFAAKKMEGAGPTQKAVELKLLCGTSG